MHSSVRTILTATVYHEFCNSKLRNSKKGLKLFRRGSKLVEYCKTCKIYIADSEFIKRAKSFKIDFQGSQLPKFWNT